MKTCPLSISPQKLNGGASNEPMNKGIVSSFARICSIIILASVISLTYNVWMSEPSQSANTLNPDCVIFSPFHIWLSVSRLSMLPRQPTIINIHHTISKVNSIIYFFCIIMICFYAWLIGCKVVHLMHRMHRITWCTGSLDAPDNLMHRITGCTIAPDNRMHHHTIAPQPARHPLPWMHQLTTAHQRSHCAHISALRALVARSAHNMTIGFIPLCFGVWCGCCWLMLLKPLTYRHGDPITQWEA